MSYQIYLEKSFFKATNQRDIFRFGLMPPGFKVESLSLDLSLTFTLTAETATLDIMKEGDSSTEMDTFIGSFAANIKLTGKPGAGFLLDLPGKDLRKLFILKTGKDVPGSFTPLPYHSADVSTVTGRISLPLLFANPRLANPWLLCPSTEQLSGGNLQFDWGTGSYNTFSLTNTSSINLRVNLVPNPGEQPGPILVARKYSCMTRSLSIDPGLVTHVYDEAAATPDSDKELSYELDGSRVFDGATTESLTAQHEIECRIDYRGKQPAASESEGCFQGTIRHLFTPIRWISEGCPVEHLVASSKGERLFYGPSFGDREVVVERYIPGGELSK